MLVRRRRGSIAVRLARLGYALSWFAVPACNAPTSRVVEPRGADALAPRGSCEAKGGLPERAEPPPVERQETIDFGDGPMTFVWNKAERTLRVESLPPIRLDEGAKLECLHVTGEAGVLDADPPELVVVSVLFGPETCGTMLGRSTVYRFDGRGWQKLVATVASELHLRPDGSDVVEWKLVSAESMHNTSTWSKTRRKKFPPAEPRATPARSFGFIEP